MANGNSLWIPFQAGSNCAGFNVHILDRAVANLPCTVPELLRRIETCLKNNTTSAAKTTIINLASIWRDSTIPLHITYVVVFPSVHGFDNYLFTYFSAEMREFLAMGEYSDNFL